MDSPSVGNIPYDATEEQLVKICEEVDPVVSFRLVIDRETGKPKGYGFCEYKDEETALSAHRNLQTYEINGHQLRVDFAENGKNAGRNREQGRGGPGVVPDADALKQFGGPALHGHPNLHHPIGDSVAVAAVTVMAGALGSAQTSSSSNPIGQNQSFTVTDPLTRHLAKFSRSQLTEIVSEVKAMAIQNKEQAQQLLLAIPNLPKALFQAQIMLGIVSPQMLQMPNIRQASGQPLGQSSQTAPGLPPLPQNKMQLGMPQQSQVSTAVPNQYVQQLPTQSQIQRPQLIQNQVLQQQSKVFGQSVPSILPQSLGILSVGQHVRMPTSSSFNQQMQHPLLQNPPSTAGYYDQPMSQNTVTHPSALTHPQFSAAGFQPGSTTSSSAMDLKGHALTIPGHSRMVNDTIDQMDRAPKMVKLNDGRAITSSQAIHTAPAPFSTSNFPGRQASSPEETLNSKKQPPQIQLPADEHSALLQQVLTLTPEQLSSFPPDQQQEVIQLQQQNKLLKETDDHLKMFVLPKARYAWMNLRLQDFKSVSEYKSAMFEITSQLKLCGVNITDDDMLEKTFSTFHASNFLLQQQYREKCFERISDLISCLLVAEQNNELLIKNHESRPVGSEVNATRDHNFNHVRGRGRGHNRGRHVLYCHNGKKGKGKGKKGKEKKKEKGKEITVETNGDGCYRCGMKDHWSRTCRTAKHLVELYQASFGKRKKNVEANSTSKHPEDVENVFYFN